MVLLPLNKIQERIDYHINELALLRRMQNCYTPAAKLPLELIAHILSFCLPEEWPLDTRSTEFRTFVRYTQVCSRWHTAALQTPSLWTVAPCGLNRDRTANLLKRAKGALLTVKIDRYLIGLEPDIVEDVIKNMSHIRSLNITYRQDDRQFLLPFFIKPGPNLRTLSLNCDDGYVRAPEWRFSFLNGTGPNLRNLSLRYDTGLLVGLHAPSLWDLSLVGGGIGEALRGMILLETIKLGSMNFVTSRFETRGVEVRPVLPAARLPCLKSIIAEGEIQYLLPLSLSLDAPSLMTFELTASIFDSVSYETLFRSQLFLGVLAQYVGQVFSVQVAHAKGVEAWERQTFIVTPIPVPQRRGPTKETLARIRLCGMEPHQVCDTIMVLLKQAASIQTNILIISLGDLDVGMNSDSWLRLFVGVQANSLRLSGFTAAAGLIDALPSRDMENAKTLQTLEMASAGVLFLSAVKDVWVVEVDFLVRHIHSPLNLLQRMKAHLKIWDPRGHGSTLHIYSCIGFSDKDNAELTEAGWAGHIDWDGHTGDTEDEHDDFCELCHQDCQGSCNQDKPYFFGVHSESDSE